MTNDQKEHYNKLSTVKERAAFLLRIGVSAQLDISPDLNVVYRAFVGDVALPIIGEDKEDTIAKAVSMLQQRAQVTETFQNVTETIG